MTLSGDVALYATATARFGDVLSMIQRSFVLPDADLSIDRLTVRRMERESDSGLDLRPMPSSARPPRATAEADGLIDAGPTRHLGCISDSIAWAG